MKLSLDSDFNHYREVPEVSEVVLTSVAWLLKAISMYLKTPEGWKVHHTGRTKGWIYYVGS